MNKKVKVLLSFSLQKITSENNRNIPCELLAWKRRHFFKEKEEQLQVRQAKVQKLQQSKFVQEEELQVR